MAPKEGNSIVKHGVLDERLGVHGVKGLKVADLSICPDNVGCNTYSTALLIGEKCAMLTAEDLGQSPRDVERRSNANTLPRLLRRCARHESARIPCSQGDHRIGTLVGVPSSRILVRKDGVGEAVTLIVPAFLCITMRVFTPPQVLLSQYSHSDTVVSCRVSETVCCTRDRHTRVPPMPDFWPHPPLPVPTSRASIIDGHYAVQQKSDLVRW